VVEDSPFGIQAGVAAGGKTIAVSTSHSHDKSKHPLLDLVFPPKLIVVLS
jgi:beta-phosphoglucomutase-like phosphatase (HAD superfamily)